MSEIELLITAIALSMDAFAVAVCKGLATGEVKFKHMMITGAWFGGFQALMPLLGYLLGSLFASYITAFDHWISFALLAIIGANMIKEAFEKDDECECKDGCKPTKNAFAFLTMLTMAIATSIDALAVGIGYAMLGNINIIFAVASIGVITFIISAVGVKIGAIFGAKYKFVAELVGGIILIIMGGKILIEHLFFGG
ncbi:MAG: manganese efflux pump [Clostridia bacterium]|nr:manganese efflux pump [Clostridia bacterium]